MKDDSNISVPEHPEDWLVSAKKRMIDLYGGKYGQKTTPSAGLQKYAITKWGKDPLKLANAYAWGMKIEGSGEWDPGYEKAVAEAVQGGKLLPETLQQLRRNESLGFLTTILPTLQSDDPNVNNLRSNMALDARNAAAMVKKLFMDGKIASVPELDSIIKRGGFTQQTLDFIQKNLYNAPPQKGGK